MPPPPFDGAPPNDLRCTNASETSSSDLCSNERSDSCRTVTTTGESTDDDDDDNDDGGCSTILKLDGEEAAPMGGIVDGVGRVS